MIATIAMAAIVVASLGVFLRRSASTALRKVVAGVLFGAGIGALVLFSFTLLYPHHHHDTEWVRGNWRWNYPIDAAFGVGYWTAVVVLSLWWKDQVDGR